MNKLTLADIQNLFEYERSRAAFRARIIALKKNRRVPVGDVITFVFENRDTMLFQVQEMARVERMVDDAQIQGELDIYNQLIPNGSELSATLLVDITDQEKIKPTLDSLVGLHHTVALDIGGERIPATFDPSQFSDNRISAVQYISFPFTPAQRARFMDRTVPARLVIDLPTYQRSAPLEGAVREELIRDLE